MRRLPPPLLSLGGLALIALLALSTLSGCEDFIDAAIPCGVGLPDLSGSWTLTGEGTRVECNDERLNGEFTIATAAPLLVDEDSDGDLSLGAPVPGFSLTGEVLDRCHVAFDVVEDTPDGPITYHFFGDPDELDGLGIEHGTFTGEGPGSCRMTGSYDVAVSE